MNPEYLLKWVDTMSHFLKPVFRQVWGVVFQKLQVSELFTPVLTSLIFKKSLLWASSRYENPYATFFSILDQYLQKGGNSDLFYMARDLSMAVFSLQLKEKPTIIIVTL